MSKKIYIIFIIIVVLIIALSCVFLIDKKPKNDEVIPIIEPGDNISFDYKIINETNKRYKNNYMISPLSIAYALSILEVGATDNTKKEIDKLLNNYNLINDPNIKDRISLANALFINNKYKSNIKNLYIDSIKTNYNSDILFDDFNTPDVINNWVNEKTYKMIPRILDSISNDFVLGIANAIAIDVEWKTKFECNNTRKETFTLKDGTKMDTAMMYSNSNLTYFENDEAKGIIKDYVSYDKTTGKQTYEENENTVSLEYIAILPNDIDKFMKNLNKDKIDSLLKNKQTSSSNLTINLKLPKYTHDFDYDDFKDALQTLGIKDAFDSDKASFNNILKENSDISIYVDEAIHKSHIELSENGTKAAAVTAFILNKATSINHEQPKIINITFDKPFIYIIKDKISDNIWFFGTVYEPLKWEKHTCENKK